MAEEKQRCSRCADELPLSAFAKDRTRPRGVTFVCSECRNTRARQLHQRSQNLRPRGPARIARRDGDRKQARSRINHDVRQGIRPNPNTLKCKDCGHLGDDRRHEYDHFNGYAAQHHGDVEPVCTKCHSKRERARKAANGEN